MGVDAKMFVRLRGVSRLTEQQVRRLSYEIGTGFSSKFFFTMNPQQGIFNKERRALEIMKPIPVAELEDHGLSAEFTDKVVWTQDGDEIVAGDDEQFVKVNLFGRYYGPGYERGDWPSLRACIFWLATKIPDGQIWYGGDSSGECAQHADSVFMAKMDRHWVDNTRRPYVRYESPYKGTFVKLPSDSIVPPVCTLCDVPMASCGGSRNYTFFWCDGCDLKASKHINGTLAYAKLYEDYPGFDADGQPVARKALA